MIQWRNNTGRGTAGQSFKAARGFTLLEVMVVLLVIGVLAGMILPTLAARRDKSALRSASQQVWQAAQYAHQRAVMRGVDHRLVLLPTGQGLPGEGDTPGYRIEFVDAEGEEGYEVVSSGAYRPKRLPKGVVMAVQIGSEEPGVGDERVIEFSATGRADAAAVLLTIDDGSGRGEAHSVLVSPNSGRVERVEQRVEMLPNDREDLDA